jgi:hypothetical protein
MVPTLLLSATLAASLSLQPGESWLFRIDRGKPVAARQVASDAAPARGEVRVSARRLMGTMLTVLNNSPTAYTYRATLVGADGTTIVAKSCVMPAGNRLAMESWPQASAVVRLSEFKPTRAANCR